MKILLIHKFHYMLGGTETFHYNLAEALTAAGHEVIFFSMYDKRNIPCAQDKYFVSNVDYNDPNLSTFKKIKMGIKKAMRCGKLYRETLQNLRRTNKWETA